MAPRLAGQSSPWQLEIAILLGTALPLITAAIVAARLDLRLWLTLLLLGIGYGGRARTPFPPKIGACRPAKKKIVSALPRPRPTAFAGGMPR